MNKRDTKRDLYLTFLSNLQTEKQTPAPVKAATPVRKAVTNPMQQMLFAIVAKAKRLAVA